MAVRADAHDCVLAFAFRHELRLLADAAGLEKRLLVGQLKVHRGSVIADVYIGRGNAFESAAPRAHGVLAGWEIAHGILSACLADNRDHQSALRVLSLDERAFRGR